MMATWSARIPADPAAFVAAAKIEAFSTAQRIYRTTLRTAGPMLAEAAESAARVAILGGADAGIAVVRALDSPYQRIRKDPDLASSASAVAGVRAFASVAQALGEDRAKTTPEPPDEVRAAIEALDHVAIEDFIRATPERGRTYHELFLVGAAFCARARERDLVITDPATWIANAIRDGAASPPTLGAAELARRRRQAHAPTLFSDGPPRAALLAWSTCELDGRHGLWAGQVVTVASTGELQRIATQGYTVRSEPQRARLGDAALAELDRRIATVLQAAIAPLDRYSLVPDTYDPSVTIVGPRPFVMSIAGSAHHPAVVALVAWLEELGAHVAP